MEPLLRIEDLSLHFISGNERNEALRDVNISVTRGEIVALVGESGSGKSVTSLSILQLLASQTARYDKGRILFSENGVDTINLLRQSGKEMQDIRGNKIAMIFQEPMTSLNPVITCGEQVMEAVLAHQKMPSADAKQIVLKWFERVRLPSPTQAFDRFPHQLSGGQKQRVMIAMAMCSSPSLLICDEPTTALDVTVQKTILLLLKELQVETGMGIIFITHDLGVVAEIADRVVVMYKGAIVEQGTVDHIFKTPEHPYTKGLLACRPLLHEKGERLPVVADFWQPDGQARKEIKQTKSVTEIQRATDNKAATTVLSVENLSVVFPVKKSLFGKSKEFIRAVDDVSFEVFQNETLGLVGESGCGKTTLGRTLLRLIEPTSGRILYHGQDMQSQSKAELRKLRKEVQIIFQDPYSSLNPRLTIGAAITEPLKVHGLRNGEKQSKERAIELLEKVDLKPEHFSRYPHEFSGGQRQRIVIARALALEPSFIVCDESVSALDVSVQAQVLNLLNDLKQELGFTVIFISHDLSVVRYISDRILVMNKGRIEESGSANDIYFNPKSPYTQRLISSIPKGLPA